jgi:hypothetical protein
MDGLDTGRRPPLELRREFASSRLERQILIRAFELVVPVIRRSCDGGQSATEPNDEQFNRPLAKGA